MFAKYEMRGLLLPSASGGSRVCLSGQQRPTTLTDTSGQCIWGVPTESGAMSDDSGSESPHMPASVTLLETGHREPRTRGAQATGSPGHGFTQGLPACLSVGLVPSTGNSQNSGQMKHVSESSDRKTDIRTARTSMPRQVRRPRSPALLPGSEPQGAQGTQTYGRGKLRSRGGGCGDLARPARLTLSAGAAAAEPLPGSEAGTERAVPTGAVCRWRPLPEAGPLGHNSNPPGGDSAPVPGPGREGRA